VGRVEKQPRYVVETEVRGMILGVRQVQDKFRIQIPKVAREKLRLNEGDYVYFVEEDEKIYIMKAVKIT